MEPGPTHSIVIHQAGGAALHIGIVGGDLAVEVAPHPYCPISS